MRNRKFDKYIQIEKFCHQIYCTANFLRKCTENLINFIKNLNKVENAEIKSIRHLLHIFDKQ